MSNDIQNQVIKLNSKFNEIIKSGNFFDKSKWNSLEKIIEETKKIGLTFVVKSEVFYEIDHYTSINFLFDQFSEKINLKALDSFIVKYQCYHLSSYTSEKNNEILNKLRTHQFDDIVFDQNIFMFLNEREIEIKQFRNKVFNSFFLELIGYNI